MNSNVEGIDCEGDSNAEGIDCEVDSNAQGIDCEVDSNAQGILEALRPHKRLELSLIFLNWKP